MQPDPQREIYPNAPLKLVALELRFPEVPELASPSAELDRRLRARLPILGPKPQEVTVEIRGDDLTTRRMQGLRRLDRRRQEAVAITPVSVSVETSAYSRFEAFREFVEGTMHHLQSTVDVPATARVGLRYIDEIDAAALPQPVVWADYIASDLLGVVRHFDRQPTEIQSIAVFRPSEQEQLVLRYGIAQHPVVNPEGPLRVSTSPKGPYFLIDIDSSWEAPAAELPEFRVEEVLTILDRLHAPVRSSFESMITDRLRDHLREGKESE